MQDFYSQIFDEYNVTIPLQNINPVESFIFTYATRRKDVAEKMVEICMRNGLSLMQAVNVLRFFANPFHYSFYPVAEILYFSSDE